MLAYRFALWRLSGLALLAFTVPVASARQPAPILIEADLVLKWIARHVENK